MKKAVRIVLALFGLVVLLVVVALAAHPLWLGPAVRALACPAAARLAGTPVRLEACAVNLYEGRLELRGLDIANPAGCAERTAVGVGSLRIDFDAPSALRDVVVIRSVDVSDVFLSYEKGASGKYNMSEIADNVASATTQGEPQEAVPSEGLEAPGRKVVIDRLSVSGVRLAAFGVRMPVPGALVLTGLGRESQGVSVQDVVSEVLAQLRRSAGALGDGLTALGAAGLGVGQKGVDAGRGVLTNVLESVKGANVDGARDALRDAGGSLKELGKDLKGLGKDLKGLLKAK